MGWFEVINTATNLVSAASLYKSSRTLGKMHQSAEERAQAAQESAEIRAAMAKIIDRVKRITNKLRSRYDKSPQAVMVVCKYYDKMLEDLGITPAVLNPEDKPTMRELNDQLDQLSEDAEKTLSVEEKREANECVAVMLSMPRLNEAITAREEEIRLGQSISVAQNFLASSEHEWQSLLRDAQNYKNVRLKGMILLGISIGFTCLGFPLTFALTTMKSGWANFASLLLILLWLGASAAGVYFMIKSRSPYAPRYKELETQRKNASDFLRAGIPAFPAPEFANYSLEQLKEFRNRSMAGVIRVLERLGDPGDFLAALN